MAIIRHVLGSFEAQMEELRQLTGVLLPPTSAGATAFFSSLNLWLFPSTTGKEIQTVVLPDPSLNLSLPFPEDELSLAATCMSSLSSNESIESHCMKQFGLPKEVLARPVTALSGGERMLVSLAKATFMVERGGSLIVCSPFFWLDPAHRALIRDILSAQDQKGVNTRLLTLDGEDTPGTSLLSPSTLLPHLDWVLSFKEATASFPSSHFPRETSEKNIRFTLPEQTLRLKSPTLISGSNGIGKTTFSKLLAGLLYPADGQTPRVTTCGFDGKVRLLMQDTIVQLFSDSPNRHIDRVFRYDKHCRETAHSFFDDMQSACAKHLSAIHPAFSIGDRETPDSIFQAKLALIAERLTSKCSLLILDEPGWCLTRAAAQVLVQETVKLAHKNHTAVALISHQAEWWRGIVSDHLYLQPTATPDQVVLVRGGDIP